MKVFDSIDDARKALANSPPHYIGIGNFDGCHIGHQRLIQNIVSQGRQDNCKTCILTFDPSPKVYFDPSQRNRNLFNPQQKLAALKELGVDLTILQPFTEAFSKKSPDEFIEELSLLKCEKLFVGSNFKFGAKRKGDITYLRQKSSFDVVSLEMETVGGTTISSTQIRRYLEQGNIKQASLLLGRPYELTGAIVEGDQVGRSISFPTANLDCQQMIPMSAVYCGYMSFGEGNTLSPDFLQSHIAVFNIGTRPTVSTKMAITVEGHAIKERWPTDKLYQQQARFHLVELLRQERQFKNLAALQAQIKKDCEKAQSILENNWT